MIFTSTGTVSHDQLRSVRKFCEEPEVYLPIPVDGSALSDFCRRWKIRELAVFGSVLREDFRPDSDVDFLATFAPDAPRGLVEEDRMRDELRTLVGRKIDLVSRRAVERSRNWIRRRSILESARTIYVEG